MRFVLLFMVFLIPHAGFAETIKGKHNTSLHLTYIAEFNEPWAIEQLDDQSILLTEKSGQMWRVDDAGNRTPCLLYTSPSPRDLSTSRMPSSA